jgi:hypothetical protein
MGAAMFHALVALAVFSSVTRIQVVDITWLNGSLVVCRMR